VELFRNFVATGADDETAIVGAAGVEVDETLKT
jgi:hypothetical protein